MSFRLLLHSPIPVIRRGESWSTLDLWAVDLDGQRQAARSVTLLCPVRHDVPFGWQSVAPLPAGVTVVDVDALDAAGIDSLVATCDVVQTYGGQGWRGSATCRQLVRVARRRGVASIVGLSSNRARTALLNGSLRSPRAALSALRGALAYVGLRANYFWLTARASGTFIVGEGLRPLVAGACKSLHVGIASWTRSGDMARLRDRPALPPDAVRERNHRLCIASRLERMKGVHLGIEALALLEKSGMASGLVLTIYGVGGERDRLEAQAAAAGIASKVRFAGALAYPTPFLDRLETHGIVVLPNLNDEQPRLVFDAIGCGCLPLCPDRIAYRAIGLPPALLYRAGDARSLADALAALRADEAGHGSLRARLREIGERHTLESMHARRAEWIRTDILA